MRLRSHLVLLTLATLLPMFVFGLSATALTVRREQEVFRRGAQERTLALLTAVDTELTRHVTTLRALASSRHLQSGDLRAFYDEAVRMLPTQPYWRGISLVAPSGDVLFRTAQPFGTESAPIIDRPSFDEAALTGRPVIGSVVRDGAGHRFPVRLPIVRDGRTRYVVSVSVDPAGMLALLSPQRLPPDWVGVVLDRNRRIVARTLNHGRMLGQPASQSLRSALDDRAEGWFEGSTIEGSAVYTPFNRSRFSGWTVAMGIPRTAVDAAAVRASWMLAAGTLAAVAMGVLIALVLGRRISSPIASLASAATHLGTGGAVGPPDPSGLREIDDVGRAMALASTAIREREKALRAADRAKDEFLAMLGHELRNPLGALSSASALLQVAPPEDRGAAVGIIDRQVRHMIRLVDDLLDASRATTGKIQLSRRPLDLAEVTAAMVRVMRSSGKLEAHEVVLEAAPAWVEADEARIEQIVANLLGNALKYTARGGRITVSVHRHDGEAVLQVEDTGVGIPPDLLPHVFDLFVQGEPSLDRSSGGLGIGLTMVQRLVDLHGGRVEAASEGVGRGARLTVTLPAIEAAPLLSPVHSAEQRAGGAPGRVLLVEDNDDSREMMRALLEHHGHEVFEAADGPTGVLSAAECRPHVVVIDIGLPGFDGYEVARRLRASPHGSSMLLVALTGYGQVEAREQALRAGFDEHLTKPVAPDRLNRIIASRLTGEDSGRVTV